MHPAPQAYAGSIVTALRRQPRILIAGSGLGLVLALEVLLTLVRGSA